MPVIAHQPFKGIYAVAFVLATIGSLPWYILKYAFPKLRPHSEWTLSQAINVIIIKTVVTILSRVRAKTPLELAPGPEKERLEYVHPGPAKIYKGPLATPTVSPGTIYGIWYPKVQPPPSSVEPTPTTAIEPPAKGEKPARQSTTILHFHGGAFAIGDPRAEYSGFAGKTLTTIVAPHAFLPAYRLSSNSNGAFPAALQDTVSSYAQMLRRGHLPEDIVLSGDSAGANLVIALLRYLHEYGEEAGLPLPRAALLWSPWIDVLAARGWDHFSDPKAWAKDYIGPDFVMWGSNAYAPRGSMGDDTKWQAYVGGNGAPFECRVPIWVDVGEVEFLNSQVRGWAEEMRGVPGNRIELRISEGAPHDLLLTGKNAGMIAMAEAQARAAASFLDTL